MTTKSRNSSLWPKAIMTYFVIVITGIAFFITWAVRQNMDLVRKDYYAEELRFQEQLDRVHRTGQLNGRASIAYHPSEQGITIAIPQEHIGRVSAGVIHLYRPSNARLDKNVKLELASNGTHRIDATQLEVGYWKVRLYWKLNEEEFYFDDTILVRGKES